MTVFDEIDGKGMSHMAEPDHTDTSDNEALQIMGHVICSLIQWLRLPAARAIGSTESGTSFCLDFSIRPVKGDAIVLILIQPTQPNPTTAVPTKARELAAVLVESDWIAKGRRSRHVCSHS
jgi:hypothetical protein